MVTKIEPPKPLKQLLEGSDLETPVRDFANRVGEILEDNKLPFFPNYTDHGPDHINRVLKSIVELVPKHVWEKSNSNSAERLLTDADAAVVIGATLLHDLAMHLRKDGFLELIRTDSRFKPLPWFRENHDGHSADRPWNELWRDYLLEARRFSDRDLSDIVGEQSARTWRFRDLPEHANPWDENHCLIVGEFLRRHHARLAHEIAIYGFPGLPAGSSAGQFPAIGTENGRLMQWADLIGVTARSHGMSLRVCKSYLEASPRYSGTPKPMGAVPLYSMALLRVADYLQIDQQRAPAVLLQLRNPQSPVSVKEWQKHLAVQHIGPAKDPRAKMVTISDSIALPLYLQLKELLAGAQTEIDHSSAVLDEIYGAFHELGLNELNLSIRRVHSNLQNQSFKDQLPYVPEHTGFTADPHLLTLLVEPLYGNQPGVGVRELVQNAVDAVSEAYAWCEQHGRVFKTIDFPVQSSDVLLEFKKRRDDSWLLRITDKGIGMRSETIQNYFLRAGASFRRSAEYESEYVDEDGRPRLLRNGKFGIGAFASFLLGPSFRVETRHIASGSASGYSFEASTNSQLIEVRRVSGLHVGTTVEVELTPEAVDLLCLEKAPSSYAEPFEHGDWYCWDWPKVERRIVAGLKTKTLKPAFCLPIRGNRLGVEWSQINPKGFDSVHWTFDRDDAPHLSCNGLVVDDPTISDEGPFDLWHLIELMNPRVAVLDRNGNLPLTTQRYGLSRDLPFERELCRDVLFSFIGHALVSGPPTARAAFLNQHRHPMAIESRYYGRGRDNFFCTGALYWCATSTAFVPIDPWLHTLLGESATLVGGTIDLEDRYSDLNTVRDLEWPTGGHFSIARWDGRMREDDELYFLDELTQENVRALGQSELVCAVISSPRSFAFPKKSRWKAVTGRHKERFYAAVKGKLPKRFAELQRLFSLIEPTASIPNRTVFFLVELEARRIHRPQTLIAEVWNECLGAHAIPFDTEARKKLIAAGRKHPQLQRHIAAWEQMKREHSKWVK